MNPTRISLIFACRQRGERRVWKSDDDVEKVNYGSRSPLFFLSNRLPDGGREFPFSFMLTVSSLREIHPPMICCDLLRDAMFEALNLI